MNLGITYCMSVTGLPSLIKRIKSAERNGWRLRAIWGSFGVQRVELCSKSILKVFIKWVQNDLSGMSSQKKISSYGYQPSLGGSPAQIADPFSTASVQWCWRENYIFATLICKGPDKVYFTLWKVFTFQKQTPPLGFYPSSCWISCQTMPLYRLLPIFTSPD